jgi:ribonuclease-3
MPLDQQWWYQACGRFQQDIGHTFSSFVLLEEALTHASYANEKGLSFDNQRLEFLGDAVLELGISDILFTAHPEWQEGELTRERALIVCEVSLAKRSVFFGIPRLLRLGRGLDRQGGRENPSICADALEAFAGALYLDGGKMAAEKLVRKIYEAFLREDTKDLQDYKSLLQMRYQILTGGELPVYTLLRQEGAPHNPRFHVGVFGGASFLGEASGGSRKEAENEAARKALASLELPGTSCEDGEEEEA